MLDHILASILKVSSYLQTSDINLLIALELIQSLKKSPITMRNESLTNDETDFRNIFSKVTQLCGDLEITIPPFKKGKVSTKLDGSNTQYFVSFKEEEMTVFVYYLTLDKRISGIDIRYNQETMDMIQSVGNLIMLNTNSADLFILSNAFDVNSEMLVAEIKIMLVSQVLRNINVRIG